MSRAVLSLGSNLGDRAAHLRTAVAAFGDAVVATSPVVQTPPWGGAQTAGQQPYLNAVVVVEAADVDAHGWLARAQAAERAAGRVRSRRWGPRTLDVDVVSVTEGGREVVLAGGRDAPDPDLVLPHPWAHRRAFVLVPWHAVDPDARLTVDGAPRAIATLIAALDPAEVDAVTPVPAAR